MTATSKHRGIEAAPASITPSVRSQRNRVAAARLRVTVDKRLGIETPKWIRELAETKAS